MCIKKVEMFQGTDGGHYATERDAVIGSIAHIMDSTVDEVEEFVVSRLDQLLPLLHKLGEPRNKVRIERAKEAMEPVPGAPSYAAPDLVIDATDDQPPIEWGAEHDIDLMDLRPGQIIEVDDGAFGQVEVMIDDVEAGVITGRLQSNDLTFASGAIFVKLEEIKRVISQPEERLDLDAAQALLAELEAEPGPADETALRHKRKILLHRRIAQLTQENNE